MTVLENVLVGAHSRMRLFSERAARDATPTRCSRTSGSAALAPEAGRRAAVRDAEADRARARARVAPAAAAARRAGGRPEPRGGRGARRADPPRQGGLRPDHPARRAPHEPRDVDLRPRPRAQLRPEDRRGHARRGAGEPRRDRGVPGSETMPLLELRDVEARYGAIRALHGVSLDGRRGRGRRAPRRERRRQDDDAARDLRLGPQDGRRSPSTGKSIARACAGGGRAPRHRARARGPRPLRRADGLGEPPHGRVRPRRAQDVQAGGAARARLLPLARGAQRPAGGHAERRRAADARARPRARLAAAPADARRAVARARADGRQGALRDRQAPERGGGADRARRRAEREHRARRVGARLRARGRQGRGLGRRATSSAATKASESRTWATEWRTSSSKS